MNWPDSNRASHENQAARENIVMERARRRGEAWELEDKRWPYRAVQAGVAAKLARHFTYFIINVCGRAGTYTW